MNTTRLARNEIIVLGALALLVIVALLVPWSRLALKLGVNEGDYAFAHIRRKMPGPAAGRPDWSASTQYDAKTHYSPGSGKLTVTLSHKYNAPVEGLNLRADFSAGERGQPASGIWLKHQSGATYSADNMTLPRGDWVMSLTGSQHSEPLFRLEKALSVGGTPEPGP